MHASVPLPELAGRTARITASSLAGTGSHGRVPRDLVVLALASAVMAGAVAAMGPLARRLLLNTGLLAAGTTVVAVPWGAAFAICALRCSVSGARLALAAVLATCLVPLYLQAAAWLSLLGPTGWLRMGVLPELVGWPAATWIHGQAAVPWVVLIVVGGLAEIHPAWEEQALLTMRGGAMLLRIVLPLLRPSLLGAAVCALVLAAGEMSVTDLFRVRTFAEEVYTFTAATGSLEAASVSILPGLALSAAACGLMLWYISRITAPRHRWHGGRMTPWGPAAHNVAAVGMPLPAGGGENSRCLWLRCRIQSIASWLASAVPTAVVWGTPAITLLLPTLGLARTAGTIYASDSGSPRTWSFIELVRSVAGAPIAFSTELAWTAIIAAGAGTVALFAGGLLASLSGRRVAGLLAGLVAAACLATPGPVVGLLLIHALDHPGPVFAYLYDRTLLLPILGATLKAAPLAFLALWYSVTTLPQDFIDLVRQTGRGWWRPMFCVFLPMRWPAVIAAWLLASMIAAGELPATILVAPPGVTTLAMRIFDRLHTGADKQVAAICLAMLLGTVALGWLVVRGLTLRQDRP